ncbi:MAG: DUF2520 domain-containing protein, partial [Clostridia bacterium]|nr:DUF2520 domain-containing protein [Clostridia bacterium]
MVGPGRVGTALAMLLAGRGWSVAGAVGRDPGRVATFVGRAGGRPLAGLDELVRTAHVVLVTVRD